MEGFDPTKIDWTKLQQESEEAQKQKAFLKIAGAVGDSLASAPSWAEVSKGIQPRSTMGATVSEALSESVGDPLEKTKRIYEGYKMQKEAADASRKQKIAEAHRSPESPESQQAVAFVRGINPRLAKALEGMSKDQLDEALKNPVLKAQIDQEKEVAVARAKKGFSAGGPSSSMYAFKHLPPENQEQIKDISKKTAAKKSINNQINAAIESLDNPDLSEEQKLMVGRQLVKVLNSTEGQDAVGSE